jgi:hypothetical protein
MWSWAQQEHILAEIGRQLRELYEVGSRPIPNRLAQLIEK